MECLKCVFPVEASVDLEDLISHPDSQARQGLIARHLLPTHLAAMPNSQGLRGAHLTLCQRISHQEKINTASDTDTRLHLPSSSSQQTSRQASTGICEGDKLQLASEVSSRESSAPASLKDPTCHLHCSTIT